MNKLYFIPYGNFVTCTISNSAFSNFLALHTFW